MEQDGMEQSTQLFNLILISIIKMNIIQSYIRDVSLSERLNNYTCHMSVMQLHAFNADNLEDQRERSSALTKESQNIVGMGDHICLLTNLILQKDGCQFISLVGMGGLGKTLLAQNLFKSKRVQHGFDYLVWLAF